MEQVKNALSLCPLFSTLSPSELETVCSNRHISLRHYAKEQVVAFEEDPASALCVVAEGSIHIQRIFPSGKLITIETFTACESFGEALMFSDANTYPATLIAKENATVLFVPKELVIELCAHYPAFLTGLLKALSNRILLLNQKIKSLSFGSVRQKVAHYLLEERRRQKSDTLLLASSRHELADSLGIPRPSLSRELITMKEFGWIIFQRRMIEILDGEALESTLRE